MCGDLAYRATIGIINKPNINCCPCQLKPQPTSTVVIICKIKTPITLNPYPPEQARMILPQNMYTSWYWTGSVYAFARVCNLRCKKDAQKETQDIAWQIDEIASDIFPISWNALRK